MMVLPPIAHSIRILTISDRPIELLRPAHTLEQLRTISYLRLVDRTRDAPISFSLTGRAKPCPSVSSQRPTTNQQRLQETHYRESIT
jgi:hypothetical protein